MFKNRKLIVTMVKNDGKPVDENSNAVSFEEKATFVLHKLESFAAKAFVGMCIYIVLDTRRQVRVAEAIYGQNN